jgi:hypothetical protein
MIQGIFFARFLPQRGMYSPSQTLSKHLPSVYACFCQQLEPSLILEILKH